jgi:hypothetical protein
MAVDEFERIDIVSSDDDGSVVLIVSDHLNWSDSISHQRTLQSKLNVYLAFVKSGEVLENFPDAMGKPVILRVVRFTLPIPTERSFCSGRELRSKMQVSVSSTTLGRI